MLRTSLKELQMQYFYIHQTKWIMYFVVYPPQINLVPLSQNPDIMIPLSRMGLPLITNCLGTKGQLISKCLFGYLQFFQKNKWKLLLWSYLKLNCFRSFSGRIEDTKEDISKLTDLYHGFFKAVGNVVKVIIK